MSKEPVSVSRDDNVVTVVLELPERRNPISDPVMVDALEEALRAADADPGVRAVILTGAGSAFSSGGDLSTMRPGAGGLRDHAPVGTRRNYKQGIQRLPLLLEALEVPVIAAINGPAIGAGCDLACMCDIRIAARSARFAESFVKVGLIPGDGGAWLLPRIVGFSRATEMALTGDIIDADTALAYGLVSQVVPDDELLSAAGNIAAKIAANPAHAVRLTRRLLREAHVSTLPATLELSAAMQALMHETRDHAEAIDAFEQKRKPDFSVD
ncbi:MAG: crotonase/enoyl-CoA hydratase family protein [Halioglobus sp.]